MERSRRHSRPELEVLEAREVPTTASLAGGVLTIHGTNGPDHITVSSSAGRLSVSGVVSTFAASAVARLMVFGSGGNDVIDLARVSIPSTVHGGDGNDTIYGSQANDTLYGDAGNDVLYGEGGADTLIGGAGSNTFWGGTGRNTYTDSFNLAQWAVNGMTHNDVQQGTGGTCAILATLAGAADAGLLAGKIAYLGHDEFSVRLYSTSSGGVRTTTQTVFFNGTWTDTDAQPTKQRNASNQPTGANTGDFWTTLYQRAVLQQDGVNWHSARAVETLGSSLAAAQLTILGRATETALASPATMRAALKAGAILTAGTRSNTTGGLVPNHAYSVRNIYQVGTQWRVTLYNPWGIDGASGAITGGNDGIVDIRWSVFVADCYGYCQS